MAFARMVGRHVVRYNDLVICALSEEDRLALIDLSTGLGRLLGIFSPDDVTFSCLVGRRYAARVLGLGRRGGFERISKRGDELMEQGKKL